MLIGQLPVFPIEQIEQTFGRVFQEPMVQSQQDMLALNDFGDKLFDAHIEALRDFVMRILFVVYFSSDLYLIPLFFDVEQKKEFYGQPKPVLGYRATPLLDLDQAFEREPDIQVISESKGKQPGSDFWVWNQAPAELSESTTWISRKAGSKSIDIRVKEGFVRSIDSVILMPKNSQTQ